MALKAKYWYEGKELGIAFGLAGGLGAYLLTGSWFWGTVAAVVLYLVGVVAQSRG